ncbi:hypothetical protein HG537_0G01920 [Torulaspora globosa]|uniref:Uncharacterized protein n=1 Tax=Torulaspora globosa TaxID=48254 RepID=A0A7H9HW56_9SACH|nr:hypothetical protein HG537_0G01920 [Torulaspora sp. CBS 2947]
MEDQVLGRYIESRRCEKEICGRGGETSDEMGSFERQLKKIWIYSSGKEVGSVGRTQIGNKMGNTVSKPAINRAIKLNSCLKERAINGKGQIELDFVPEYRTVPSGDSEKEKQGENGQEASGLTSESSISSENVGDSVEVPLEDVEVRESLQKMSEEIMRYELRLASLHGRIAVLKKENERLRDDRALRESLASQLADETERRESKKPDTEVEEDNSSVDTDLSIEEIEEREFTTDVEQDTSPYESSKGNDRAYRRLKQLESRILERLEEYRNLTATAEENVSAMTDERNALQLESPFVMQLKDKIIRLHDELTQVRSTHKTHLSNMKRAFQKEHDLRVQVEQHLNYDRQVMQKWAAFGEKASEYITRYRSKLQQQEETISYYKKKEVQTNNLQAYYKNAVESFQSLSQVAEARKKDIEILSTQLNNSKLKNKSLEDIILRQRAQMTSLLSNARQPPLANFPASQLLHSTTHEHNVNNFSSQPVYQQVPRSNTSFRATVPTNMQNGINDNMRPVKQESPVVNLVSDQIGVFLESPNANEHRDRT